MVEPDPQTKKSLPSNLPMEELAGIMVVPMHPSRSVTWGSSAEGGRGGLVAGVVGGGLCLSVRTVRGSAAGQ